MIAIVVSILLVIASVYIPLFQSYVSGCVHKTSNDTFISSRAHAISYNLAALGGNGLVEMKISAYNAKVSCANSLRNRIHPSSFFFIYLFLLTLSSN